MIQFYNCCYSQKKVFNPKRYVVWEENMDFSWDYFLLKSSQKSTKVAAFVVTNISCSFEIDEKENIIICYTQTYLNKKKSWSLYRNKKNANLDESNNLLNHERGHFDISEIYARESRMLMSKIETNSFEKAIKQINKIMKEISNKDRKESNYDKETEHGKNKEKQAEWDKKIAERLKELEQYKDITVVIRMEQR
jgi:superfamily II DNA helicase RecQ